MAEPGKQQMGDGRDNYGQAAKETSKAAKNIGKGIKNAGKEVGKNTATQAAVQGTDAAVKATSAMAKAGVEAGKAVSKVAAGTAAGGPWGAAIMAALSVAWAMRHTLFKILICVCLVLVIFIAFIPVKNIRHGIIETNDGRYIKILEIEPINFMLRSEEEQLGIISSFANWLKISPMRLQFKSVTRKADSRGTEKRE